MSIPKTLQTQRDFSAGQVDSDAERRDDSDIQRAAVKVGRNCRPLETGGLGRRPGRRIRYPGAGRADFIRPTSDVELDIQFGAGTFTARDPNTGAVLSSLSGCPWTAGMLDDLSICWVEKQIFVAYRTMRTQVLTYDADAGTWSRLGLIFQTGQDGERRMPFYRFAAKGVTLTPSALTGVITLTASDSVFTSALIGQIVRYVGKQIYVSGVSSGTLATGTVLQPLPPSQRLTVGSTTGYAVGTVVEGDTTGARAEVAAIVSATEIDVVMMTSFSGFETTEFLVGPNARSEISAVASTTPKASVQWDEQFVSNSRGWPGSISFDRKRLIMCDFNQLEGAVLWSAVGALDDFLVGAEADDAIFDLLPHPGRALYVLGGPDEYVFSTTHVYYVPISASTPLAPGTTEFRPIASEGAARVRPVSLADGAIYVSASRKRVYAIQPTGQQTRPYITRPTNDLHTQIFNNPVAVAAVAGVGGMAGDHIFVVNDDGSLVVGRYDTGRDWIGWFPWDGAGRVTDLSGRFDRLTVMVAYDLNIGTVSTVEEFDVNLPMDGVVDADDTALLASFVGATMVGMANDHHLGNFVVGAAGVVTPPAGVALADMTVGFDFEPHISPFVRNFEGGEDFGQRKRRRKVARAVATVRDTHIFEADGRRFAGWLIGEEQDLSIVRPARNTTYRWRQRGRSFNPEVNIRQPTPGRFNLIELAMEVTI